MMKKTYIHSLYMAPLVWLCLMACQDKDDMAHGSEAIDSGMAIRVGGIASDELVTHASVTRAGEEEVEKKKYNAEDVPWLIAPLKQGMNITYGRTVDNSKVSKVAILTLQFNGDGSIKYAEDEDFEGGKAAEYTFFYKYKNYGTSSEAETTPSTTAQWFDNGAHFFEGLNVPARLVNEASNFPSDLTTDQHNDADGKQTDDSYDEASMGNYTLLSHYLSMPSNYTINATVKRIKLPFRHRLARVLAYILIDPAMVHSDAGKTRVKIQGYKKDAYGVATTEENPSTSEIKFCNVKLLDFVQNNGNADQPYQPVWTEQRKVIPHFVGERGSYDDSKNQYVNDAVKDNFIAYYNTSKKDYIYPTSSEWATAYGKTYDTTTNLSSDGMYERIQYGLVPVYDLIVRPTYTTLGRVMYDEATSASVTEQNLLDETNQIEFEITLDNGLKYSKVFEFDLDANYQTVVYLRISHERVDYDESGSDLWVEDTGYDDYYGVNNKNENNLSFAGSGWQRAYTNKSKSIGITDGHYYHQDNEDVYAQYVDDATWIEMFLQAHEGGKHHGDYFILDNDIKIPQAAIPENFVFTGHLDGLDHTITLTTNGSYTAPYDRYDAYDNAAFTKYKESGTSYVEFVPATGVTYYQKGEGDTYTEITNMDSYAGSTIYTKQTNESYNYTLATLEQIKAIPAEGTGYWEKIGGEYKEIVSNISSYISSKISTLPEIYTQESDNYTKVTVNNINDLDVKTTYYKKDGDTYEPINLSEHFGIYIKSTVYTDTYTEIKLYKKVHVKGVYGDGAVATHGFLFTGLNGKYETAQEKTEGYTGKWEANVHYENGKWVPYKTTTDGWRAEIINTNIKGGTVFKSGVYNETTKQYTTAVTGYVHNCWTNGTTFDTTTHKWDAGATKVQDYTPSIPEY